MHLPEVGPSQGGLAFLSCASAAPRQLLALKTRPTLINYPDPRRLQSLLFFDFLAFFVFRCPLLFGAFVLSFPEILGVPRREKPLLFPGFPLLLQKSKGWRVRVDQK